MSVRFALAKLMMRWRMDGAGDWPQENADAAIEKYADAAHDGDCTKRPYTCMRCECDMAFKQADEALALIGDAT